MIIPTGFGQANFRFGGAGLPTGAEVTMGFRLLTGSAVLPNDIAADLADVWNTSVKTQQCNQIVLDEVYVKLGPNATGPDGVSSYGVAGTLSADMASCNTAILWRKVTGAGGRRGRGRMFWPGPRETDIGPNGALSAGALTSWNTTIGNFSAGLAYYFIQPVLLHSAGITVTPAPTDITSFAVLPIAGTQRQRMRR